MIGGICQHRQKDRHDGIPRHPDWVAPGNEVAFSIWKGVRRGRAAVLAKPKTFIIIGLSCLVISAAAASIEQERLDYPLTLFINRAANSVFLADITQALQINTFMGVVPLAAIWLIWFDVPNAASRASIVAGVIGASVAAICSRGAQLILPTHLRPLHDLRWRLWPRTGSTRLF
jgi:hypothetical protein